MPAWLARVPEALLSRLPALISGRPWLTSLPPRLSTLALRSSRSPPLARRAPVWPARQDGVEPALADQLAVAVIQAGAPEQQAAAVDPAAGVVRSVSSRSKLSARCAETRPPWPLSSFRRCSGSRRFRRRRCPGRYPGWRRRSVAPLLTSAPWPWLSSAPPRLMASSPSLLERVPPALLSRLPPVTVRPCHPESRPAPALPSASASRRSFPALMMRPCWPLSMRLASSWRSPAGWKSRRPGGCRGRSAARCSAGRGH